ncbi:hypothetical protein F383_20672 [Gossypium arboreum]|uniref:Uncharacterized protein n=1 Tax=Gossypium arboreum TaxID=29729 RepID=A0A0B0NYT8_GOSAR|nr:hypothetical protein F383_20671 [Gossypium arboreum]KHG17045.1 hypothetical protein F383_20672 [Gossypium arboreum]
MDMRVEYEKSKKVPIM